jgi:hypothetical protein
MENPIAMRSSTSVTNTQTDAAIPGVMSDV